VNGKSLRTNLDMDLERITIVRRIFAARLKFVVL
jgi:hypothetical protein